MFKGKSRKLMIYVTLICLLVGTNVSMALATEKKDSAPGSIPAGIEAVYDGSFAFSPNYTSKNSSITAEGEQFLYSLYPADGYFEMLLDSAFNRPTVSYREGLPSRSFSMTYHSAMGGTCWVYDSGTVVYDGDAYFNLRATTSSSVAGLLDGMQGSDNYIPDAWWTDSVQVN